MRSRRGRNATAAVLGGLAVVLLVVATVAVWARATVSDSERAAGLVGDALEDPEVDAALAKYLTDLVFTAVDIDALLSSLLPDELQRLEPVLAAGLGSAVDRGFTAVLSSPEVQQLLNSLVEQAHQAAMRLLQGDGLIDGITVDGGAVTVNLLPLVGRGVTLVQEQFGLLDQVNLPELSADGDPTTQIGELESALDRDLPDDFGQLVVYQSDTVANGQTSLQRAQEAVVFARRAMWLVVVLAVVSLVASVVVAADRWRATMVLGLGVIVAMVLTRSAVERVVDDAPGLANAPGGRAAVAAIVGGASTSLLRLAAVVLVIGALATMGALAHRSWRRDDLVLVGAVILGVVIVGVAGLTLASLLIAVGSAGLVALVAARILGSTT